MKNSKTTDVWGVFIIEAHGAHPVRAYRITREAAEKLVISYLFDTDGGIGLNGTADESSYPRVCVWNEQ